MTYNTAHCYGPKTLCNKGTELCILKTKTAKIFQEIRKTFDELGPLLKQAKLQKMDVLAGEVDSGVSDLNSLSLIQKLYQLSGEAKVCIEYK